MKKTSNVQRPTSNVELGEVQGALAVADTEPWWRAVLAITNEAEDESQRGAREQVADERLCVNSLGMADGAALVRRKLIAAREEALKVRK